MSVLIAHACRCARACAGTLAHHYEIDPKDSWLVAAAEADLPIVCPGWEDSTCGNIIVVRDARPPFLPLRPAGCS